MPRHDTPLLLTRRKMVRIAASLPLAISINALLGCGTTPSKQPTSSKMPGQPNVPKTCQPTASDIEGPFYTPNAPKLTVLAPANEPGTRLLVTGTLLDASDCETGLVGYIIDLWHADDAGAYDNAGFHLRGQLTTDAQGQFHIDTVLPGRYPDRPYRHIHLKIRSPEGKDLLTTQIYFDKDEQLPKQKVTGPIATVTQTTPDWRAEVDLLIPVKSTT